MRLFLPLTCVERGDVQRYVVIVPCGGVGLDEGGVGEVEPAELSGKRGVLRKEDGGGQEEEEEEGERRHGGGLKGTAWGEMFCTH